MAGAVDASTMNIVVVLLLFFLIIIITPPFHFSFPIHPHLFSSPVFFHFLSSALHLLRSSPYPARGCGRNLSNGKLSRNVDTTASSPQSSHGPDYMTLYSDRHRWAPHSFSRVITFFFADAFVPSACTLSNRFRHFVYSLVSRTKKETEKMEYSRYFSSPAPRPLCILPKVSVSWKQRELPTASYWTVDTFYVLVAGAAGLAVFASFQYECPVHNKASKGQPYTPQRLNTLAQVANYSSQGGEGAPRGLYWSRNHFFLQRHLFRGGKWAQLPPLSLVRERNRLRVAVSVQCSLIAFHLLQCSSCFCAISPFIVCGDDVTFVRQSSAERVTQSCFAVPPWALGIMKASARGIIAEWFVIPPQRTTPFNRRPRATVGGVTQWSGRRSLAGGLSPIYAWSIVDMWPLCGWGVRYASTNQANSAFHPFGVGEWIVIHVTTWAACGCLASRFKSRVRWA